MFCYINHTNQINLVTNHLPGILSVLYEIWGMQESFSNLKLNNREPHVSSVVIRFTLLLRGLYYKTLQSDLLEN